VSRSLLVVAGEASGDLHAGAVLQAIRQRDPSLAVFGIGGDRMAGAGAELLVHAREMAVFGPIAALAKYPFFRRVFSSLLREVDARRPVAALLVDYGGFNLRLAARLQKRGIRVLYYISPQVWASRPRRIRTLARVADLLMVIFPFEKEVYAGSNLDVEFVGHPLVDEIGAFQTTPGAELPWRGSLPIALLPGSRRQEVDAILPVMLEAAGRIAHLRPDAGFIVAAPSEEIARMAETRLAAMPGPFPQVSVVIDQTRAVLRDARAAMVASGTATIEAALLGCPMVVIYRISPLLYFIAKRLVRVPFIGMVNLVAGESICPERIQGAATGPSIAQAMLPLLEDTPERKAQCDGMARVAQRLGEPGAVDRVCALVLERIA